ncbi:MULTISPECIES: shikimate dehydrogenase [unclassified Sulfitobacter]|jgi:shikimate dehydrogenase|uniref:shikimate dehydrogenase n=1 Tax=unclassified Sulfitobacter TaxID=196795 RepID=UPI001592B859|nr:shikimate dehydrogenase [Sulfitobacter sp. HGT1]
MNSNVVNAPKPAVQKSYPDLLIGLVGRGIQKSRTPKLHMEEGAAHGQRILYQILDVDQFPRGDRPLEAIIDAAEFCGFAGLNVTFPYKIDVMPLLDSISENARAIGAVNTVVFRDGKRIGHNTDKWGFEEGFRENMAGATLDHVLQVGAGGAGVAVAHSLSALGVKRLTIADSDHSRATGLQTLLKTSAPTTTVDVVTLDDIATLRPDGVVNATPVGMAKLPGSAYPLASLRPEMWVADIVYFPLETELLAAARAIGCRVLPGSGMAVYQAVRAFELFTGRTPDPMRMKATFESFVS